MVYPSDNKATRKQRSTQNKRPARYILTPTPPPKKKQKTTENFDPSPIKYMKQANKRLKRFAPYRRRARDSTKKSNKRCAILGNSKMSNSKNFDDDEEEECQNSENEQDRDGTDEGEGEDEEEEEFVEHMMIEEQIEAEDEIDDNDTVGGYNTDLNRKHKEHRRNDELSIGANSSRKIVFQQATNQEKTFRSEFNQLRTDFSNAISKLTEDIENHHDKLAKRFTALSKNVQQTTIYSNLEKFRCDGETFLPAVTYKGKNLLDIYDGGDCGAFARQVMKILFTPAEMSESILYANPTYAKPGLDPVLMRKFKEAVRARFRISESHWHEFFTLCLRRTLTQMLCDVRRQYIRDSQQQNQAQ
ncbi:unnamed protein product [Rotaria sordida]|uniref:Uncharacterized protein n=1 Tax=Rotaria sordida TaxID=392033 RepID=A0A819PFA3_9BILA|nr:unnamed protein product [Rotaria sordida]CAF4014107.1 unnamed protein product [Rotaria sordida]